MTEPGLNQADLISVATTMIGERVTSLEEISGGHNNRILKARTRSGRDFAVKVYFRNPDDPRDRLGAEFQAATIMRRFGVSQAPNPVASDAGHNIAIYDFIDGDKVDAEDVTDEDIDAGVELLRVLKDIAKRPEATSLSAASEACFSVEEILANLRLRLDRLMMLRETTAEYADLRAFLSNDFEPALEVVTNLCQRRLSDAGIGTDDVLPSSERTLSPSDFGFHNCLRRPNGELVFLDFEYFGWDDPARLVSDFLLHPGMSLTSSAKRRFLSGILDSCDFGDNFKSRINGVYPLWGLKWSLIMLNEFVPEHLNRRRFALGDAETGVERRVNQLEKARKFVDALVSSTATGTVEDWIK